MSADSAVTQLCLEFACTDCGNRLTLPLEPEVAQCQCRRCQANVGMPSMDKNVPGVQRILRQHVPKCKLKCAVCNRQLSTPADQLGQRKKCPACNTWLMLAFVAEAVPIVETSPVGAEHSGNGRESPERPVQAQRSDSEQRRKYAHRGNGAADSKPRPVESPPSPPPPPRCDPEPFDESPFVCLEPQLYETQAPFNVAPQWRNSGTTSPRALFLAVFWPCRIGIPFFLFMFSGMCGYSVPIFGCFGIALAIASLYPAIPTNIANFLMSLMVSAIRCPGCGFDIDAVSRWSIGGFNDHRDRHIYHAWNPIDKAWVGHFNCPQCTATIRLR